MSSEIKTVLCTLIEVFTCATLC